jgi:hypothetical protein
MAGARASFYRLSVVVLEAATGAAVWSLMRLRNSDLSQFLKYAARSGTSAGIAITGTALFAWALSCAHPFHIR